MRMALFQRTLLEILRHRQVREDFCGDDHMKRECDHFQLR